MVTSMDHELDGARWERNRVKRARGAARCVDFSKREGRQREELFVQSRV